MTHSRFEPIPLHVSNDLSPTGDWRLRTETARELRHLAGRSGQVSTDALLALNRACAYYVGFEGTPNGVREQEIRILQDRAKREARERLGYDNTVFVRLWEKVVSLVTNLRVEGAKEEPELQTLRAEVARLKEENRKLERQIKSSDVEDPFA